MYQKIIVSLSLDHGIGDAAIELARGLKSETGTILAVHVHEPLSGPAASYMSAEAIADANTGVKAALAAKVKPWDDVEGVLLEGHSGRAITDYAKQIGADLIVVGSHKPGMRHIFLGSTATRIVQHAECSVHVLR